MTSETEASYDLLKLSGMIFDGKGVRKWRFGKYLHKWKSLSSVAIETPVHKGYLVRMLVLTFVDQSVFALPIDRGFKNTFLLESILRLLTKESSSFVQFTGQDTVLGIRDRFLALEKRSKGDDQLIIRARVLLDALELERTIRLCDQIIERSSRWEQAARTLKVRALLFCGQYLDAKSEIKRLEEFFDESRESNVGLPLTSLSSEQPSGAWYARTLLDEYERHIINQGVELSDLLTTEKNYDDVVDMIDSLKIKFPLEKLNLDSALDELYRKRSSRENSDSYLFGKGTVRWFVGRFVLFAMLTVLIGRVTYISMKRAPELMERSSRILSLDKAGLRANRVRVDPTVEDVGLGLRKIRYSFQDLSTNPVYGEVWYHGDSLVFVPEAVKIVSDPAFQFVTYNPHKAWVSEIGTISLKRVFALWLESWEKFQGVIALIVCWLLVCLYYIVRGLSRK